MKTIKTSKHVTHHCRLHASGALNQRCKHQCKVCKQNEQTIPSHSHRRSELLV